MARPAYSLDALGDGLGRAYLADQVYVPDVYSQLQRRRTDHDLELPAPEGLLDLEPRLLAQAPVVGGYAVHAALLELVDDRLGPAPRVGEDEGGPVLLDEFLEPVEHLPVRDLVGQGRDVLHGAQDAQVEVLLRAGDGQRDATQVPLVVVAHQELRYLLYRCLGRRQPDARELLLDVGLQALQGQREQDAALGGADLVYLVDNNVADVQELLPELRRREHDGQRLRCGDEEVGRRLGHLLALVGARVPRADPDAYLRALLAAGGGQLPQLAEGLVEVLLDVVREGLERRDVDGVDVVLELPLLLQDPQLVYYRQERGQRLAAAGRRGYEGVLLAVYEGYCERLRLRELLELPVEPVPDERVHELQHLLFRLRPFDDLDAQLPTPPYCPPKDNRGGLGDG